MCFRDNRLSFHIFIIFCYRLFKLKLFTDETFHITIQYFPQLIKYSCKETFILNEDKYKE